MVKRCSKTPQEKKAHSLEKDCRNDYGNNVKAARRLIPFRKAKEIRQARHNANQDLAGAAHLDEAKLDLIESSTLQETHRVRGWRKSPDTPLGVVLKRTVEKRDIRVGRKARSKSDAAAMRENTGDPQSSKA